MKIVFSIGGSLVVPDEIDPSFIEKFCSLVDELDGSHKIAIVVGGGRLARKYINAADKFNLSNDTLDYLGIEATHLNAMLVASCLGAKAVYKRVVSSSDLSEGRIVVTGGTTPGHSTDAVAADIAVKMKADLLVNASNIKGVYEEDPNKNPNAKMIDRISSNELLKIVSNLPQTPGKYALIDRLAVEIIGKNKIRTMILDGRDFRNLSDALAGRPFNGTLIV